MSGDFFAVQVRVWPRLVCGVGGILLARHEFAPPADNIGGLLLFIIALWGFASAARLIYKIWKVALWP
jgi:hypothetical protein